MVQLSNSSRNTTRQKVVSQAPPQSPPQTISSQMFVPRGKSKRKATNENLDLSKTKKSKRNDLLPSQAASVRLDLPSTSTTLAYGNQRIQNNAPESDFNRGHRSRSNHDAVPKPRQSQNVSFKQPVNMLNVPDDDEEENESNFDSNQHLQHDDEYDLVQEQLTQNRNRSNSHRNVHRNNIRSNYSIDEADDFDSNHEVPDTNDANLVYQHYFDEKFDQLRVDLANTTNTVAGDVQTQLNKINKQLQSLSKTVQDNTTNSAIANYQNLSNSYPKAVPFNGINLLTVSKSADYKKYARSILRLLFTTDALSNSILISNPLYTRPGLDTNRMATWAEAVGARFKIDPLLFDDFFRTCLRRTVAQMLCDIRRAHRRSMNNIGGGGGSASSVPSGGNRRSPRGISSPLPAGLRDSDENEDGFD